jgi:hypothetical protein
MGYQPRIKSHRGAMNENKKPLREKGKERKHIRRPIGKRMLEENHTPTEKEVSDGTLKRLHTLGIQKFGSSPFSEHFDRWLSNVEAVLGEFESNPNICVDDQFVRERSQTLSIIKRQLEGIRCKEASLYREINNLSECRSRLKQISQEYATLTSELKGRKRGHLRRLYSIINKLKRNQENIIRMKTGFFRGISKKGKEQKEIDVAQELSDKQRELELIILEFNVAQKQLREQFERKREPVLEEIKHFRKRVESLETDGSLEERWFACEALIDAVNSFLQRKATQPSLGSN